MLGAAIALLVGCGAASKGKTVGPPDGADDAAVKAMPYPDFEVEGEAMQVHHGRGGTPAFINNVTILVHNRGVRARTLRVHGIERLHGSCDAAGWNEETALEMTDPKDDIVIEAGESTRIAIVFNEVECFNACDRFAFRVSVDVDGTEVAVEARVDVQRD